MVVNKFLRLVGLKQKKITKKFDNPFKAQRFLVGEHVKTIFDVGANTGQTVNNYRRRFPTSTIYTFEPFPETFKELKNNVSHDPAVVPIQLALSNKNGSSTFHVNSRVDTNSLLSVSSESKNWVPKEVMDPVTSITVNTQTVDSFCQEHRIAKIDILKLDTQGAEILVLEGAHNALKNKSISLVYAEVTFVTLYDSQPYFHDVAGYLAKYGYRLYDIYDIRYSPDGQMKWADAIFLPN